MYHPGGMKQSEIRNPTSEIRLVVCADDFGLSPGVNFGVLDAFRSGIVRGASLVVTGAHAERAAQQAAEVGLELGLHLNLTTGRPLCPPSEIGSLVDRSGRFFGLGQLAARMTLGLVRREHLERELAAQLARADQLGVRLAHLNSHHHVHLHPLLAPQVLELAATKGLAVRCPVEPPVGRHPRDLVRGLLILAPALRLRRWARARGVRTSEHFRGIGLGYGFGARALAGVARGLREGVTELMCHPGYPDRQLASATRYVSGRERELAAVLDARVRAILAERRVALVSWSEAVDG